MTFSPAAVAYFAAKL